MGLGCHQNHRQACISKYRQSDYKRFRTLEVASESTLISRPPRIFKFLSVYFFSFVRC